MGNVSSSIDRNRNRRRRGSCLYTANGASRPALRRGRKNASLTLWWLRTLEFILCRCFFVKVNSEQVRIIKKQHHLLHDLHEGIGIFNSEDAPRSGRTANTSGCRRLPSVAIARPFCDDPMGAEGAGHSGGRPMSRLRREEHSSGRAPEHSSRRTQKKHTRAKIGRVTHRQSASVVWALMPQVDAPSFGK